MIRPAIYGCALVLAHAPDLVRYGSKPTRSAAEFSAVASQRRSFEETSSYPPNQVFIGNLRPEDLWDIERPWWKNLVEDRTTGPFGVIVPQSELYRRMADSDHFGLFILNADTPRHSDLVLYDNDEPVGVMHAAQEDDDSLSAAVLLENLACKATGVLALERLLAQVDVAASEIEFTIGCGEEAVGDRYQRGGGNLAKAIAEQAGCSACSGHDVKAFCAAPMHAMLVASSLVAGGVFRSVVVVAGGSLAKLGMKFAGSAKTGGPILEDTLAGLAFLIGPSGGGAPVVRLDSLGRHLVSSGSAQQAVLADLVIKPLEALGMKMTDVGRFATELHDPEITEPAGAGNVPSRNYRMLAAMAVLQGQLSADGLDRFERERGMPGFSPTQGHVASAIPWLPHGLARLRSGELENTMLLAKGSLFLGRMTEMADGLSLLLVTER